MAAVVATLGENWMQQLPLLCSELHRVGADLPKYWRKEFVETWEEIAKETEGHGKSSSREKVAKYIKYRLRWVRQNPPISK